MNTLNDKLQAILVELLTALDGGASVEACLARYPNEAHTLRPYLELHTELLGQETPGPSAADYDAGRQALLERLSSSPAPEAGFSLRDAAVAAWTRLRRGVRRFDLGGTGLQPALMRVAAVGAIFLLIGGGTLGASAAAGFRPSRAVLSSVGLIERDSASGVHVEGDDDAAATPRDDDDGTNESGEDDDAQQVARPPESDGNGDGSTPVATLPGSVDVRPIATPPVVIINPTPAPLDRLCVPSEALQWYPQLAQYVRTCAPEEFAALIAPLGNALCAPEEVASQLSLLGGVALPVCTPAQAEALVWYLFAKGYCVPQAIAQRVPATSTNALRVCTPDVVLSVLLHLAPSADGLGLLN
jgi:hypothetical protein